MSYANRPDLSRNIEQAQFSNMDLTFFQQMTPTPFPRLITSMLRFHRKPTCIADLGPRSGSATRLLGFVLVLAFLPGWHGASLAAEVRVSPGVGTLAAVIASASDGDTLLLEDGTFTGDVTVGKSLVIRPVNRAIIAMVVGTITIEGAGISVTMQGLHVEGTVVLTQAAAIHLIQNTMSSIQAGAYQTTEGDGSLVIIGNRVGGISGVRSAGAYLAGNTTGYITVESSAWIVGNNIEGYTEALQLVGAGAVVRVIGNRLRCVDDSWTISTACIDADQQKLGQPVPAVLLIMNNVIEMKKTRYSGYAIKHYSQSQSDMLVLNNVVRWLVSDNGSPSSGIVINGVSGRLAGNLVVGFSGVGIGVARGTSDFQMSHNLCFGSNCPETPGSIDADPQFVDLVDYHLRPSSPAINAGPPDFALSDLDRSRNDMGVYGGPWSIDQFDAQRDPDSFAPFVYPLFQGGSPFAGGELELRAIGVARLR